MPKYAKVEIKPGLFLPYGTGCDILENGERISFCDNCEECPLPDCKAGFGGDTKFRFKLCHNGNNGNGHKEE